MKCNECIKEGKTSKVYPQGGTSTLMYCPPFYDEAGVYHHHDCNVKTFLYRCSRGHTWIEKQDPMCPGCGLDWVAKPATFKDDENRENRARGTNQPLEDRGRNPKLAK